MKKSFLLLFFLAHFLLSQAQSLAYTNWMGTKPASINLWFNFDNDTLRYSTNGSLGSPLSKYYASNGQFYLYDFGGTALCQDTGFYTYSISGSNLIFSLLVDNCTSRRTTLLNYTWTSLNTAVSHVDTDTEFYIRVVNQQEGVYAVVVPKMSYENQFSIFDLSGKLVHAQRITEVNTELNLTFLQKGIYIATYQTEGWNKSIKLVK